jgi:hypothetical protein
MDTVLPAFGDNSEDFLLSCSRARTLHRTGRRQMDVHNCYVSRLLPPALRALWTLASRVDKRNISVTRFSQRVDSSLLTAGLAIPHARRNHGNTLP